MNQTDNVAERPAIDMDEARAAIAQADPNVLRMVLVQLTGEARFREMKVVSKPVRSGAWMASALADEHHDEVRAAMLDWLRDNREVPPPPSAPDAAVREMMGLLVGRELTDPEVAFGWEELAYEDFPRDVNWTKKPSPEVLAGFQVLIIGAGISGITAAIQLDRLGIPYRMVDRQADIGGTWQLNRYPEARVDTIYTLYQYKFEKGYRWSEYYPTRAETQKYLNYVIDRNGIRDRIELSTAVTGATWDEASARWQVTLSHNGQEEVITPNAIVSCSGLFATANMPDIPGITDFQGAIFHTTAWNHDYDIAGKRGALIGNGSTGTQLMPAVAREAETLTVYQRTPQWVSEIEGYKGPVSKEMNWLLDHVPYYWNWVSFSSFITTLALLKLQTFDPEWQAKGGLVSEANDRFREGLTEYIKRKVNNDPALMAKCVPDYAPLARRLVVDNGWFEAIQRDNVELVTDGIERITQHGIRTVDGRERETDFIVLAAGFAVSKYLWPATYTGRDGVTLEQKWAKDGARAYLGLTVPGFPNLFTLYGPNAQPRSGGGMHSWSEIWTRYALKAIVAMIEGGHRSIDVRQDVFDEYNTRMDAATVPIIWESEGAKGYYVNEYGRNGVSVPWETEDYFTWLQAPNLDDFVLKD